MVFVPESTSMVFTVGMAFVFVALYAALVIFILKHSAIPVTASLMPTVILFVLFVLSVTMLVGRIESNVNSESLTKALTTHYGMTIELLEDVDFDADMATTPVLVDNKTECSLAKDGDAYAISCDGADLLAPTPN